MISYFKCKDGAVRYSGWIGMTWQLISFSSVNCSNGKRALVRNTPGSWTRWFHDYRVRILLQSGVSRYLHFLMVVTFFDLILHRVILNKIEFKLKYIVHRENKIRGKNKIIHNIKRYRKLSFTCTFSALKSGIQSPYSLQHFLLIYFL